MIFYNFHILDITHCLFSHANVLPFLFSPIPPHDSIASREIIRAYLQHMWQRKLSVACCWTSVWCTCQKYLHWVSGSSGKYTTTTMTMTTTKYFCIRMVNCGPWTTLETKMVATREREFGSAMWYFWLWRSCQCGAVERAAQLVLHKCYYKRHAV